MTLAGSTLEVSPPIDATGQTYTIDYTVTDRAGAAASARVTVTVTEPKRPPPTAVPDVGAHDAGRADLRDGARQRRRSRRPGPDAHRRQRDRRVRLGIGVGRSGRLSTGPRILRRDDVHVHDRGRPPHRVRARRRNRVGHGDRPAGRAVDAAGHGRQRHGHGRRGRCHRPTARRSPTSSSRSTTGSRRRSASRAARTLSGLVNGQPYIFRVRAANEAGWGDWSEFSAPVTPDTTPGRPSSPTVAFGDGQLTLTWAAPANEGSAITGYEVEIGGGLSAVVQRGTATTYAWTGLQNGTNYQFRVTAINAAGRSEPSPWSDPEHPLREPGDPGVPVAARGDRYIDLSWAPSNPNGDPVIEYQVEMGSNPGVWVPVGTSTSYRWSNLRQRRRPAVPRPRRATATPTGAPSAAARPRSCRAGHRCSRRRPPPSAPTARPSSPTSTGRRGLRDHGRTGPRQRRCHAGRRRVAAHVHRPRQRHRLLVRRAGPERGRLGPVERRRRTPWFRPDRRSVRARSMPARRAWAGSTSAGRPPTPTAARSTQYQISVNGSVEGVGLATSMRRAGLADSTTYSFTVRACNDVACGAWSPARQATTNGPPNQQNAPNMLGPGRQHDRGELGHPERQRPRGRQLRCRHRSGRLEVGQRHEHDVERHARQQLPGPRPGLQRGRLRAVERVEPDRHDSAARRRDGQLPRQRSEPARLRQFALHVRAGRRHRAAAEHRLHRDVPVDRQSERVSARRPCGPTPTARLVDDPACYYGYAENFWATVGPYRSNTLPPPPP